MKPFVRGLVHYILASQIKSLYLPFWGGGLLHQTLIPSKIQSWIFSNHIFFVDSQSLFFTSCLTPSVHLCFVGTKPPVITGNGCPCRGWPSPPQSHYKVGDHPHPCHHYKVPVWRTQSNWTGHRGTEDSRAASCKESPSLPTCQYSEDGHPTSLYCEDGHPTSLLTIHTDKIITS